MKEARKHDLPKRIEIRKKWLDLSFEEILDRAEMSHKAKKRRKHDTLQWRPHAADV